MRGLVERVDLLRLRLCILYMVSTVRNWKPSQRSHNRSWKFTRVVLDCCNQDNSGESFHDRSSIHSFTIPTLNSTCLTYVAYTAVVDVDIPDQMMNA